MAAEPLPPRFVGNGWGDRSGHRRRAAPRSTSRLPEPGERHRTYAHWICLLSPGSAPLAVHRKVRHRLGRPTSRPSRRDFAARQVRACVVSAWCGRDNLFFHSHPSLTSSFPSSKTPRHPTERARDATPHHAGGGRRGAIATVTTVATTTTTTTTTTRNDTTRHTIGDRRRRRQGRRRRRRRR